MGEDYDQRQADVADAMRTEHHFVGTCLACYRPARECISQRLFELDDDSNLWPHFSALCSNSMDCVAAFERELPPLLDGER